MIQYYSTRTKVKATLKEALIQGMAPDGGLYLPLEIPPIEEGWRDSETFPALALKVLNPFLRGAVPDDRAREIVEDALSFEVPLIKLEGLEETYVVELFHGPTLSFKDFGARVMARLMNYYTRGEEITILVATSGDTGSAVADGFSGLPGLRVALLFPEGQVSEVQERQLTLKRSGVRAFKIPDNFDTCQAMVKKALRYPLGLKLSAANSINLGRLLPQMPYYFWAMAKGNWPEAVFAIPSGNLGNLTAGILATRSGLPATGFLAAHNANNTFPRFLSSGLFDPSPSVHTLSNAMDVGSPNNFERLQQLLPDMSRKIAGYSVSDEDTLVRMRRVYDKTGYIADPHTAVGLEAVHRYRKETGDTIPCVVLATAHPAKFPETVEQALGQKPVEPESLAQLASMPKEVSSLAPGKDSLMHALRDWDDAL